MSISAEERAKALLAQWEANEQEFDSDDEIEALTLSDIASAIRAAENDALERAAKAAEEQNRVGREWVPDSLWDNILKRIPPQIRSLKSSP